MLTFSLSFLLEDHFLSWRKEGKSKEERERERSQRWKARPFLSYLLNSSLTASSRSDPALCCKGNLKSPFDYSEQTYSCLVRVDSMRNKLSFVLFYEFYLISFYLLRQLCYLFHSNNLHKQFIVRSLFIMITHTHTKPISKK